MLVQKHFPVAASGAATQLVCQTRGDRPGGMQRAFPADPRRGARELLRQGIDKHLGLEPKPKSVLGSGQSWLPCNTSGFERRERSHAVRHHLPFV